MEDNTIRVGMMSHSYIAIDANAAQDQELREFFAFFAPGYQYMPAYKRKVQPSDQANERWSLSSLTKVLC